MSVSLAAASTGCAISGPGIDDDAACQGGKCDDAGPRRGLLYAPLYTHSNQWRIDGQYGLDEARRAARTLEARGWASVEVVPVRSLDAMLADLDRRDEFSYDLVGTVSHAGRGGPLFDDSTDTRTTVQAGWSWFGPTQISRRENGGPVDLRGLEQLTDRLKRVVSPSGKIVFSGCKTAAQTISSVPRSSAVTSAYAQGTPFFIPGRMPATRYKTYVHAIADLTNRITLGSKVRMNLNLTDDVLETIYYGGEHGSGGVPSSYISVLPGDAKADIIENIDRTYVFDTTEGVYVADGGCDEWSGECDTEDPRWDLEE